MPGSSISGLSGSGIAECPICLGHFDNPVYTTCGHRFCYSCIRSHIYVSRLAPNRDGNLPQPPPPPSCPLCRHPISEQDFIASPFLPSATPSPRASLHGVEVLVRFAHAGSLTRRDTPASLHVNNNNNNPLSGVNIPLQPLGSIGGAHRRQENNGNELDASASRRPSLSIDATVAIDTGHRSGGSSAGTGPSGSSSGSNHNHLGRRRRESENEERSERRDRSGRGGAAAAAAGGGGGGAGGGRRGRDVSSGRSRLESEESGIVSEGTNADLENSPLWSSRFRRFRTRWGQPRQRSNGPWGGQDPESGQLIARLRNLIILSSLIMIIQGIVSVCFWEYSLNFKNNNNKNNYNTDLTRKIGFFPEEKDVGLSPLDRSACRKLDVLNMIDEISYTLKRDHLDMGRREPATKIMDTLKMIKTCLITTKPKYIFKSKPTNVVVSPSLTSSSTSSSSYTSSLPLVVFVVSVSIVPILILGLILAFRITL